MAERIFTKKYSVRTTDAVKLPADDFDYFFDTRSYISLGKNRCDEHPFVLEVCEALEKIVDHLKANPSAKFGIKANGSPRNLFFVTKNFLQPIFIKIQEKTGVNITPVLKQFHNQSNSNNLFLALGELKNIRGEFNPLYEQYFLDLQLIEDFLIDLYGSFSTKGKQKKIDDNPFCKYCFRETHLERNVCYRHLRSPGKHHERRFNQFLHLIRTSSIFHAYDGHPDTRLSLTLFKIREVIATPWPFVKESERKKWLVSFIKALDLCSLDKVDEKSVALLTSQNNLQKSALKVSPNWLLDNMLWPYILNMSCYRHEAYLLAELRRPTHQVRVNLQKYWRGEKKSDIAREADCKPPAISQQVKHWTTSINDLRSKGVKDEIIKLVLELELLPPNFD